MTQRARLIACGRVDLDGTHRAIIAGDLPELGRLKREGGSPPVLELSVGGRRSACLLTEISESDENRIYLDRFKLKQLGLKDGDKIDVSEIAPPAAEQLILRAPPDFRPEDAVRFIGKPLVRGEQTALFSFAGEPRTFTVVETRPAGVVLVDASTRVALQEDEPAELPVSYDDIGGLDREIKLIREVAEYPFRFPEVFSHLGVTPPKGIILHGPPGTGKTLIAKALAGEVGARFYTISGPEVYSKWYGKSEQNLRNIFEVAVREAPSIVVIDELDALVPRRERSHGDQEQRIVATFLTQMDGLRQMKDVVVVGTTNRLDAIDPALRRGGRFEHEVHIGVPDPAGREEILRIHTRGMPVEEDVDLGRIAEQALGFVGADIAALCREAAYNALRRSFTSRQLEEGAIGPHDGLSVSQADFVAALASVLPSGARELMVEIPRASWDDVGGLAEIKRLLVENIGYPESRREAFRKMGVEPARGILLHGPPGTGKTLLARAVASGCNANFIALAGSQMRSRWAGEAEERIRAVFAKARTTAPCVIFIDEVDAAAPRRVAGVTGPTDGVVNQLLAEMDGVEAGGNVFVIGATNRIELLDPALLRPGRFDFQLEVPLPAADARRQIFEIHLRGKPLGDDVELAELVEGSAGLSGAEIKEICRQAAWGALRGNDFDPERVAIAMADLRLALEGARAAQGPGREGAR